MPSEVQVEGFPPGSVLCRNRTAEEHPQGRDLQKSRDSARKDDGKSYESLTFVITGECNTDGSKGVLASAGANLIYKQSKCLHGPCVAS
jgi:hypothetical protein